MRWILRDTRFAFRTLRRRRAFSTIAIATIAIGIGAATSIYSVVDGILVRPLAFMHPDRIVSILQTFPGWKKTPILAASWDRITLSQPEYRDLRDKQTSFSAVGIWTNGRVLLTRGDKAEQIRTIEASSTLLSVLGVAPLMGRTFAPDEETPHGARVAMISYEVWQDKFTGARDILGRVALLDDVPYTIVGVLPQGLRLGRTAQQQGGDPSLPGFWIPAAYDSTNYYERTNHSYFGLARLKPGVSLARAADNVARILKPIPGDVQDKGTRLVEWQRDQTRDARAPLLVLLAAAGLLLLIVCVNVATLMLGEAANREQEMAARVALGASRGRIVVQLLTESTLLAIGGLSLGAGLAWWGTRFLVALAPARIPGLSDVHVDMRVLGAALLVSLLTGALFGLAPALTLSSTQPSMMLRAGGGQSSRGRGALQRVLIAVELALSVVLLVGAGLLSRTLQELSRIDPGFRASRLLVVQPWFPQQVMRDSVIVPQFYDAALSRLASLPGVSEVTAASQPPFGPGSSSSSFKIEGEPESTDPAQNKYGSHPAQQRVSVPGYFAALGIPIRLGRDFTQDDRMGSAMVAVVSTALVKRDFGGESPIGRRVMYQGVWRTIVGVAEDVHLRSLSHELEPTIYTPVAQRPGAWSLAFVLRAGGDPAALTASVRKVLDELAPRSTTETFDTMDAMVRRSFAEERYRALLASLFGIVAAVLAAVGIYGVTSRAVTRRTREIAIRTALGATGGSIASDVIGSTLVGGLTGVAAGLAIALAAARLLAPYLFGVSANDPTTYGGIVLLLVTVSVGASWLPARRATRVSLAETLRAE